MPANWVHQARGMQTAEQQYEDPWGDDLPRAEPTTSGRGFESNQGTADIDLVQLAAASLATPREPSTAGGIASLHSLCLGYLARFIEDIIDLKDAVDLFTHEEKMALMAAARRQGILRDEVLAMLIDEDATHLDLSFSAVSPDALQILLPRLPKLRHLSLLGVDVSKQMLLSLSDFCPSLESLRVGCRRESRKGIAAALQCIVPQVQSACSQNPAESWEDAAPSRETHQHLTQLRYLIWPDASEEHLAALLIKCPKLIINPTPKRFSSILPELRLPKEADMRCPLDAEAARSISQVDWDALPSESTLVHSGVNAQTSAFSRQRLLPGELSIADRFKLAYKERAERQALKAERNRKQAWRRYVRANPTAQLILLAESGVPLTGKRP